MRTREKILIAALVALVFPLHGLGQDREKDDDESERREDQPEQLPKFRVEVVAPPVVEGNSTDRYGSLITAVSETQITDLNSQDLSSALRRVPGVSVSRYDPIGAYGGADGGAIYIRGQGSGRPGAEVSILMDGVPRFVGVWTHPLLDTVNVDQIRRIDIYKGPQPVLMGNMAFAAMNIVPRTHDSEGFSGSYGAAYGGFGTVLQRVQIGGRQSKLDFDLTGSFRRSDGHRENASGQTWALDGTVGLRLNEHWRVSAYLSHTNGWADDPGDIRLASPPVTPSFATDDDFYLVVLSHRYGNWEGALKVYDQRGLLDWLQWDSSQSESFRTLTDYENYGLRFQERYRPWEKGEILFGFDQDFYGGAAVEQWASDLRNSIDLHFRNSAPYVMFSQTIDLGDYQLTPSAGIRRNASRFFGAQWGPQAGITLDRGATRYYANYANGFNLPGVYVASFYAGWGRGDQWKNLRPERIRHVEAGVLHSLTRRTRLSWSLFHDRVDDAIRFVAPPPPPPQFANLGSYRVIGSELSLDFFVRDNLAVFTGTNYQSAQPSSVPNAPRWLWVSGLGYLLGPRWRFNLDAEWVDRQFVLNPRFAAEQAAIDPYFFLNSRAAYRLGRDREIFLAVENIGNTNYEFRPGYPMPGRTWMIGLKLGFTSERN